MHHYLTHLLSDIASATENVSWPFIRKEGGYDLGDWIPDEEEERMAPVRELDAWTGIRQEQLPPVDMLSDEQVHTLLVALKKLLDAYNCSFVLQTEVPERIQYMTIRGNFCQEVKVKQWNHGFFKVCADCTKHHQCLLGDYCQCAFYAELFSGFVDEELTSE